MQESLAWLVGLDPRRPWPGVGREPIDRVAGLDALVGTDRLDLGAPSASQATGHPLQRAIVCRPVEISSAADPGERYETLARRLELGGFLVTEEPGAASTSDLEPLVVTEHEVVLASVAAGDAGLDVAIVRVASGGSAADDDVTVTRFLVQPLTVDEDDAIASVNGFELVARWSDWSGSPAGDGWRVTVRRRSR